MFWFCSHVIQSSIKLLIAPLFYVIWWAILIGVDEILAFNYQLICLVSRWLCIAYEIGKFTRLAAYVSSSWTATLILSTTQRFSIIRLCLKV